MTKYKEPVEVKEKWSPSFVEVKELTEAIKPFPQTHINGLLQSPFDQYCASQGVISFDEYGKIQVFAPDRYTQLLETNEWRRNQVFAQDQAYYQNNPDEKKKMLAGLSTKFSA